MVLAFAGPALSQTQLGSDIDGEAANDQSGYSVSLSSDGTRVAIGAPTTATAVTQATCGSMSTVAVLGLSLAQTSTARRPMINRASRSPCQTMASGWRLGRLLNDSNGTNSGHVRVYEYSGSAWTQVGGRHRRRGGR